eukprot:m.35044 g.35044  ORF g.35044 m.35044 type:complete len:434 (+) comp17075_c0_seq1:183-1484(+)
MSKHEEEKMAELDDSTKVVKKKQFGPALPGNLTKRLDDDEFFKLYKEHQIHSEGGLTEENWEEEIEKIPLFMTKDPTPEQIANSPDIQAMQQLIAEETPDARALNAKEHANIIFMKTKKLKAHKKVVTSEYHKAIKLYDEAIAEKSSDQELNSVCHSNKAAINLILGNNRKVINDCTTAIECNPKNIKAYYRAHCGCMKLSLYGEAIDWADKGLRVDPAHKQLGTERVKAVKLKAALEKKVRQEAAIIRKKEKADELLVTNFTKRGLRFQKAMEVELEISRKGVANLGASVYVDDNKLLHWPVMFLYPEHKQTDFVKDFCEGNSFEDHLGSMFPAKGSQIPWDSDRKYKITDLEIYFESQPKKTKSGHTKTDLVKVDGRLTLLEAMRDPRYTIVDFTPGFFVCVKGSPFLEMFLKDHDYTGLAVDTSVLDVKL